MRCGAEVEIASRLLAARPNGRPPTVAQRAFMELLRDGGRYSHELSQEIDYNDSETFAAVRDAQRRGWVDSSLGGIGGLLMHPPAWYELTQAGREALGDSSAQ
jgi:hypothetical protein